MLWCRCIWSPGLSRTTWRVCKNCLSTRRDSTKARSIWISIVACCVSSIPTDTCVTYALWNYIHGKTKEMTCSDYAYSSNCSNNSFIIWLHVYRTGKEIERCCLSKVKLYIIFAMQICITITISISSTIWRYMTITWSACYEANNVYRL